MRSFRSISFLRAKWRLISSYNNNDSHYCGPCDALPTLWAILFCYTILLLTTRVCAVSPYLCFFADVICRGFKFTSQSHHVTVTRFLLNFEFKSEPLATATRPRHSIARQLRVDFHQEREKNISGKYVQEIFILSPRTLAQRLHLRRTPGQWRGIGVGKVCDSIQIRSVHFCCTTQVLIVRLQLPP